MEVGATLGQGCRIDGSGGGRRGSPPSLRMVEPGSPNLPRSWGPHQSFQAYVVEVQDVGAARAARTPPGQPLSAHAGK